MDSKKKKNVLHPRNIHQSGYDFPQLTEANRGFKDYIIETEFGTVSIDFANPKAVIELNKALLKAYYNIQNWSILKNSLCPPIPGRADYIHYVADLLAADNDGVIPTGAQINVLDIGTGSSVIYPILGERTYGWKFLGTDIDIAALNHARSLVKTNEGLSRKIVFQLQENREHIFEGILNKEDYFDLVVCNPPFFASREENWQKTTKKFHNVHKGEEALPVQNFGGHPNELWCKGGERKFVRDMINESMRFKKQLGWTTSLVSNKENLKPLVATLEYNKASQVEVINMMQGQKAIRILAWKW
ncbi:23S rRNA (adenine(1618)-N(6))-methyltransferase RlmF [Sphingobacterium sp. SGR-19]|uniref:23S rRNA (adenine(1618)-N(6))-methyltransferase RlmF n=1 Tax=Sphingobacterium sp. SGR-19 TaxID=2710886 RepID=UPI0013EB0E60|nr:23S rRNA (adenine(1618)-N(6))-methyltransferase RlmF [Sphingobacterium sp. SGR-19]NGM65156.1 23S rRNA (adenine(1618)-N(6))-methyltransferase RlmF [Sphingobacterium sp. SGR-19]